MGGWIICGERWASRGMTGGRGGLLLMASGMLLGGRIEDQKRAEDNKCSSGEK